MQFFKKCFWNCIRRFTVFVWLAQGFSANLVARCFRFFYIETSEKLTPYIAHKRTLPQVPNKDFPLKMSPYRGHFSEADTFFWPAGVRFREVSLYYISPSVSPYSQGGGVVFVVTAFPNEGRATHPARWVTWGYPLASVCGTLYTAYATQGPGGKPTLLLLAVLRHNLMSWTQIETSNPAALEGVWCLFNIKLRTYFQGRNCRGLGRLKPPPPHNMAPFGAPGGRGALHIDLWDRWSYKNARGKHLNLRHRNPRDKGLFTSLKVVKNNYI